MNVYLWLANQQVGPYPFAELRGYLASGQITYETPACFEGASAWSTVAALLAQKLTPAQVDQETAPPVIAAPVARPAVAQAAQPAANRPGPARPGPARVAATPQVRATTQVAATTQASAAVQATQQSAPAPTQQTAPAFNTPGLVGFILSLFGLSLIGIFFSVIGLKRQGLRVLTIIGLVFNILGVIGVIIITCMFFMLGKNLLDVVKQGQKEAVAQMQGTAAPKFKKDNSSGLPEVSRSNDIYQEVMLLATQGKQVPENAKGKEVLTKLGLGSSHRYEKMGALKFKLSDAGADGRFGSTDDIIEVISLTNEDLQ